MILMGEMKDSSTEKSEFPLNALHYYSDILILIYIDIQIPGGLVNRSVHNKCEFIDRNDLLWTS